jgi:protein-L-isoaspartate(D-aspartate) O-methyltransferase
VTETRTREPLKTVRRRYAEHVCAVAETEWAPLLRAFASVPRERFLGAGPWTILNGPLHKEVTPDADPRHVYRNVLVALDEAKQLNNGQPSFWATLIDRLRPRHGERVVHVGAGGGYYTAILAELVGWNGWVTGIEYEPWLAAAASAALADRPNVEVLAGDAHELVEGPADVIVASCGFDTIPLDWVRALSEGGRLMLPLTAGSPLPGIGVGGVLMVTRRDEPFEAETAMRRAGQPPADPPSVFDAEFVSGTMIYHDKAGRSDAAGARLAQAFRFSPGVAWAPPKIASLRLGGMPDETAWLTGDGWWLSTSAHPREGGDPS